MTNKISLFKTYKTNVEEKEESENLNVEGFLKKLLF